MIEFKRYPHVCDLFEHYAKVIGNEKVNDILDRGVKTKEDAYLFGRFVIAVIDRMAGDMQNNVSVLGSVDNTSMIPDIDYEVSLYFANVGMGDVWDAVCDED